MLYILISRYMGTLAARVFMSNHFNNHMINYRELDIISYDMMSRLICFTWVWLI